MKVSEEASVNGNYLSPFVLVSSVCSFSSCSSASLPLFASSLVSERLEGVQTDYVTISCVRGSIPAFFQSHCEIFSPAYLRNSNRTFFVFDNWQAVLPLPSLIVGSAPALSNRRRISLYPNTEALIVLKEFSEGNTNEVEFVELPQTMYPNQRC